MRNGMTGKLVAALGQRVQFIPGNVVRILLVRIIWFAQRRGLERSLTHFRVGLVDKLIRLLGIFPRTLVVHLACLSVVARCSLITEKADRGSALKKIVFVSWGTGGLLNDGCWGAANERTVVLRAGNFSGNDEERGGKTKAVHERNCNAKLIDASVVVGQGNRAALAILPFANLRLPDLSRRWSNGNDHQSDNCEYARPIFVAHLNPRGKSYTTKQVCLGVVFSRWECQHVLEAGL